MFALSIVCLYIFSMLIVCSELDLDLKDEIQKLIDKNKEDDYEEKLATEVMLKKKILEAYAASEKDMFSELEKNYDSKAKYIDDMLLQKRKLLELEIAEKRSKLEEETNNILKITLNMIKKVSVCQHFVSQVLHGLRSSRQKCHSLKNDRQSNL